MTLFIVSVILIGWLGVSGCSAPPLVLKETRLVPCPQTVPEGACPSRLPWPKGTPITPQTVTLHQAKLQDALRQCRIRDQAWEKKYAQCQSQLKGDSQ